MPENNITAVLDQQPYEIIATLDKYPYQGIQATIDKLYLWNPDEANTLIEKLNELLQKESTEIKGSGNIVVTKDENIVNITENTFIFEFDASRTVWEIEHNLNKQPSVCVVDSANNEIECKKHFVDENVVEIEFNSPFKGKAYLN